VSGAARQADPDPGADRSGKRTWARVASRAGSAAAEFVAELSGAAGGDGRRPTTRACSGCSTLRPSTSPASAATLSTPGTSAESGSAGSSCPPSRRTDSDISLHEHRVTCNARDVAELQSLEKKIAASAPAPALAAFPLFATRICFSPAPRCGGRCSSQRSHGSSLSLTSTAPALRY
jgi:hypothetical protein